MLQKILLAATLISTAALAAEESTSVSNIQSTAQVSPEVISNSSTNRVGKTMSITAEIIGHGPSQVNGQGLNFGFFLGSNTQLMLELNGGKNEDNGGAWPFNFWSWNDRVEREGFSAGVSVKQFVSNSFYLKGGVDYRQTSYKYTHDYWFSTDYSTREFKGESTALSFGLGNQWQLASFTLGCDWFGMELPVASRIYDEKYSANADQYDRRDNERDMKYMVKDASLTLLRFYLGASF